MPLAPSARSNQIMLAVQGALAACCAATPALAQQSPAAAPQQLQEVVITGSRIAQTIAQSTQPLSVISSADIEKTGLASVGELLQQLTTGGSALNAKFNSSGNFGYPPDGGGIGAGSAQVALRNLDSKRVLVLVDGLRWVNESSASGVSGYTGEFSKGGRTTEASLTAGGSSGKFSGLFVASFYNQDEISSSKWAQSDFPEPNAGLLAGSSATPQGRFRFCDPSIAPGPDPKNPVYGSCDKRFNVTLNNGAIPSAATWDKNNPTAGTYHNFTNADRFNYAPFNLLLTPSQRKALFTSLTYDATDSIQLYAKGLFNTRTSTNQAAPEPIFVGPVAQTGGLADRINVSAA